MSCDKAGQCYNLSYASFGTHTAWSNTLGTEGTAAGGRGGFAAVSWPGGILANCLHHCEPEIAKATGAGGKKEEDVGKASRRMFYFPKPQVL